MKTLTTPAALRTQQASATPLYLLQIDFTAPSAKTLYLSDRYVNALGHEYLPLVHDWGTLEEALNTTDTDGRPATATISLTNTVPIEGKARLSDLIRTPGNLTGTYEFAFAAVTVTQLFQGLTTGDELALGVFYIEDPSEIGNDTLSLRMSDQSLVIEDAMLMTTISRDEFPTVAKSKVNQVIPRPFGTVRTVPAIPLVDAPADQLNMPTSLTNTATTITLLDASLFPTSGTGQVDDEMFAWTGKTGNNLTGVTRATQGTTAEYHNDRTVVFQALSGTNCYRYVVGESLIGFPITAVTNIKQNDAPATLPTVQLDATDVVTGKRFAMISYSVGTTAAEIRQFHARPPTPALPTGTLPTTLTQSIDSVGNRTWDFQLTVPLTAAGPYPFRTAGLVHRHVVMTWTQLVGGTFSLSGSNYIRRFDPFTLAWVQMQFDNAGPTLDFANATYDYDTGNSLDPELWEVRLSGDANDYHFEWKFTTYTLSGASIEWLGVSDRSGDSTAQIVIGDLVCDVQGIQDDSSGTISGTAALLLENPADVTRFMLTKLFGVASGSLGSTWSATRTALNTAAYKWGRMLEALKFSQLRRGLGEQARSYLYLEAGRWEYEYLADAPTAQITFDYLRDVWEQVPATVQRSSRTDVRNVVNASAELDYTTDDYRYLKTVQDLTAYPAQRYDLTLDWIQDHATADAVAAYWLLQWKRQRFICELVTWWNALAVEKIDYVALANHPILTAHGGTALVFRIVGKSYMIGEENPGRTRLRLIEI